MAGLSFSRGECSSFLTIVFNWLARMLSFWGVYTDQSAFSPLLRIMVSPSTTLLHLRVLELEQEIDRDTVMKIRSRISICLIRGISILSIYHRMDYVKSIM